MTHIKYSIYKCIKVDLNYKIIEIIEIHSIPQLKITSTNYVSGTQISSG